MKVVIETIPHNQHRYPTCGDYWVDPDGALQIRVSEMGNEYYESMVGFHEWWEYLIYKSRGKSIEKIDQFDKDFEANRPEDNYDEPGDEPDAPYQNEHCSATGVERILCAFLGIPWKTYEEAVNAL